MNDCHSFTLSTATMNRMSLQQQGEQRSVLFRRRKRRAAPAASVLADNQGWTAGGRRRRVPTVPPSTFSPSSPLWKELGATWSVQATTTRTPTRQMSLAVRANCWALVALFMLLLLGQHGALGWVLPNHHHHHHHHLLASTPSSFDTIRRPRGSFSSSLWMTEKSNLSLGRLSSSSSSSSPFVERQTTTTTTTTPTVRQPSSKDGSIDNVDGADNDNDNDKDDLDMDVDSDNTTYQTNLQLAVLANECAWLRQRGKNSLTAATSKAWQAVRLLRNMSHPDTVAFNSVLKALAKLSPAVLRDDSTTTTTTTTENGTTSTGSSSGTSTGSSRWSTTKTTAAQLTLDLLQDMKQLHQQQVQANQAWYQAMAPNNMNVAAGGLTQEEISAGPPRILVKPNVRTYSTVMDALGRTGTYAAAEQAHELLWEMSDLYSASGDAALQPNLISYNTLLSAYAKCCGNSNGAAGSNSGSAAAAASGAARSTSSAGGKSINNGASTSSSTTLTAAADAADQCVQILLEMPIQPDVISYNAVLHALAGSGHANAGERAEELLRSMTADVVAARPNARSYSTCMNAWGQSGYHAHRAHALLTEMLELYDATGLPQLAPNAVSYATVIHAYAVSKNITDKAMKAYSVFQDMMQRGIVPNLITFNTLMNTCAMSKPTPEIFVIMEKIYQTILRKSAANAAECDEPDHFTFGTVLKACAGNLYWRNAQFAPSVFAEACRRGQVSRGVLQQFRQAVPIDTYRRLVTMTRNYKNSKRSNNTNNDDVGNVVAINIDEAMFDASQQQQQRAAADATTGKNIQYSNYTYLDNNLDGMSATIRASNTAKAVTAARSSTKGNNARRRAADDYVAWTDLPYEWRRNVKNDRDRRRRR